MMVVTDHDRLVARYSTLPEDVAPEIRAQDEEIERRRAAGQAAPPPQPDDDYLIGLDDDLQPFPTDRPAEG